MAAIKLMTDEYDRNIVYRQELKSSGFLGLAVSEETGLVLSIALPCAAGEIIHTEQGKEFANFISSCRQLIQVPRALEQLFEK